MADTSSATDPSDGEKLKPWQGTDPQPSPTPRWWKPAGLALLSFVASFLGAWVFLSTGLVKIDATRTITDNQKQLVLQEGEVVSDVAKSVGPSVVSIATESAANRFGIAIESAGTGIVVSKDGYIITNKHVIDETIQNVDVQLSDGTNYENVRVVGRDPLNDLAFLKISGVDNLTPAKIGDSNSIKVGQKVVAIGNALGEFDTSVTSGIISGIGRPLVASDGTAEGTERLEGLLQTDAAINPGNSGGPLVNLNGEVVGINTAIAGNAEGIGFAIPVNTAKGLIESVNKTGRVERAYLGVQYVSLNKEIAQVLEINRSQGAYIFSESGNAIISGSPAQKAGLRDRDIIIKVDNTEITQRQTLANVLSQYPAGREVELTIIRSSEERVIKVTLEQFRVNN